MKIVFTTLFTAILFAIFAFCDVSCMKKKSSAETTVTSPSRQDVDDYHDVEYIYPTRLGPCHDLKITPPQALAYAKKWGWRTLNKNNILVVIVPSSIVYVKIHNEYKPIKINLN